ncbi:MAG: sugar phosphate isomerase/epimerase [Lachnospiraceae bacterium]|nr:sugar phosphate isomerase/epimerase [Lachnospiraceae bacterium]
MNLSISNIAWSPDQDTAVYTAMEQLGYTGLEIAPTRIFPQDPYAHTGEATLFARQLREQYGLRVCSLQSIWYGRTERLFGSGKERQLLLDYTRRAIDFAAAMDCPNLVFGSPRNRQQPEGAPLEPVLEFFREVAVYAAACGTTLSMEPNPPLYHTNFINTTEQACDLVRQVRSRVLPPSKASGFAVNLDLGTMIENQESLLSLPQWLPLINHMHISEPGLGRLKEEHLPLHRDLLSQVQKAWTDNTWQGYLSIEMGCLHSLEELLETMKQISSLL